MSVYSCMSKMYPYCLVVKGTNSYGEFVANAYLETVWPLTTGERIRETLMRLAGENEDSGWKYDSLVLLNAIPLESL